VVVLVAAFTFVSWLGEYVHNRFELPQLTLFSPENLLTLLIAALLFLLWLNFPNRLAPAVLLLAWGLLHLVGGGVLSVLPLRALPFLPEQSLSHYLVHLLYGLAQLPLVVLTVWLIGRSRRASVRSTAPNQASRTML
jgi:hypothetical protein